MNRDKSVLYKPFADQLIQFEFKLILLNLPFSLFVGLRTFQEQDALYAQGRTAPGMIVTNARGGFSWHNFGLAADYVAHPDSKTWSWDVRMYSYKQMADVAKSCGLDAGFYWTTFNDPPHLQNVFKLALSHARLLYNEGGLQNVWNYLDNDNDIVKKENENANITTGVG
jgi:hypothetical protein